MTHTGIKPLQVAALVLQALTRTVSIHFDPES
jgi:hypothetical protein